MYYYSTNFIKRLIMSEIAREYFGVNLLSDIEFIRVTYKDKSDTAGQMWVSVEEFKEWINKK